MPPGHSLRVFFSSITAFAEMLECRLHRREGHCDCLLLDRPPSDPCAGLGAGDATRLLDAVKAAPLAPAWGVACSQSVTQLHPRYCYPCQNRLRPYQSIPHLQVASSVPSIPSLAAYAFLR